ncbi:TetR family transcriptional regulator [Acinetobacter sp. ANC 4635]|uniref:TetR family transcriptional regulator n=1 Tax=Acinetobacter sp. ANC 4635 TaxID=2529846 RepID=UPI00103D913A|nr:TetR family transcriptional regulator [Acinetobacter sp. ANC 4635]TCB29627.1 TetR family transcriptional regulator [Acinetobacter sp. ANC 4635]
MSVRAERKLQSQQAILDQVLKLNYAGQCFNSISLRQLAQAVGMVPSAFYRYFPNKEQLAIELVDQTALIIKSHLTQFLEHIQHKNSEILETHLSLFCGQVQQKAAHWHFFIVERWGGGSFLKEKIRQEVIFLIDDLAQLLSKKYAGQPLDHKPPLAFAELCIELHFAWIIKWLHSHETQQKDQLLRCFIQQLQYIHFP